jgi:hypothetical protein
MVHSVDYKFQRDRADRLEKENAELRKLVPSAGKYPVRTGYVAPEKPAPRAPARAKAAPELKIEPLRLPTGGRPKHVIEAGAQTGDRWSEGQGWHRVTPPANPTPEDRIRSLEARVADLEASLRSVTGQLWSGDR